MPWMMGVHDESDEGRGPTSYVASYDVDAMDGVGAVFLTPDPDMAQQWDTAMDVINAWRTQGAVMPFRPDGKENRPLTALTIEPVRFMKQPPLRSDAVPPVCPGCGTVAEWIGSGWQSAHDVHCPWLADPNSEPYG